jgi:hypothetical protein
VLGQLVPWRAAQRRDDELVPVAMQVCQRSADMPHPARTGPRAAMPGLQRLSVTVAPRMLARQVGGTSKLTSGGVVPAAVDLTPARHPRPCGEDNSPLKACAET